MLARLPSTERPADSHSRSRPVSRAVAMNRANRSVLLPIPEAKPSRKSEPRDGDIADGAQQRRHTTSQSADGLDGVVQDQPDVIDRARLGRDPAASHASWL